jgi:hypothetical protein
MSEIETIKLSLRDKIAEVLPDREGWVLVLREGNIGSIKIAKNLIGLSLDWEWHFVAPVIVYEEVDQRRVRLYRELKQREAQVERRGWLRYSYRWITGDTLTKVFPHLTPVTDLVERLNSDGRLRDLLRRSVIDELYINTYFTMDPGSDPNESIKRHYESPEKVGWLITAIKGPGSEWRFASIVRRIYELLDYLAGVLVDYTHEVERRLL